MSFSTNFVFCGLSEKDGIGLDSDMVRSILPKIDRSKLEKPMDIPSQFSEAPISMYDTLIKLWELEYEYASEKAQDIERVRDALISFYGDTTEKVEIALSNTLKDTYLHFLVYAAVDKYIGYDQPLIRWRTMMSSLYSYARSSQMLGYTMPRHFALRARQNH